MMNFGTLACFGWKTDAVENIADRISFPACFRDYFEKSLYALLVDVVRYLIVGVAHNSVFLLFFICVYKKTCLYNKSQQGANRLRYCSYFEVLYFALRISKYSSII